MSARDEPRFQITDLLLLQGIFALGVFGYLCDAHSPVVWPFLGLLGLAFSAALLVLAALIFRDSVIYRTEGWFAGLYYAGLLVIRSWE
jgi:hypothetical protein